MLVFSFEKCLNSQNCSSDSDHPIQRSAPPVGWSPPAIPLNAIWKIMETGTYRLGEMLKAVLLKYSQIRMEGHSNLYLSTSMFRVSVINVDWNFVFKPFRGKPLVSYSSYLIHLDVAAWKVYVFGVFLVRISPHLNWLRRVTEYLSIFSSNMEKYIQTRKTLDMDTF